jgi:hypothetical protein
MNIHEFAQKGEHISNFVVGGHEKRVELQDRKRREDEESRKQVSCVKSKRERAGMKWKNFLAEVFHRTLGTTLKGRTGVYRINDVFKLQIGFGL